MTTSRYTIEPHGNRWLVVRRERGPNSETVVVMAEELSEDLARSCLEQLEGRE